VKRGVGQSFIIRTKVICQDQKVLNKGIKSIRVRHNRVLKNAHKNYLKPFRSNCPFSDAVYQGTVIIPFVKDIFEKFRLIGNLFNVRTVFKIKYTFCMTLMETATVRDAQQTKQCVYSSHVIVAGVTSAKQADLQKYASGSTNITCHRVF
jgi:hypothetical protein